MAKKKNLSKKGTLEEVRPIISPEQDNTQFDVVPKDDTVLPETTEETPIQQVIPDQVESNINVEVQPEAPLDADAKTHVDVTPEIEATVEQTQEPKPKPKPLTMVSLKQEIDDLKVIVLAQAQQIADLLSGPVLKRKPVANSRVKIKDTQTGRVYPSKNNVYTSFLREGLLDDLIKIGVFGEVPTKNSFGWYALNRTFPG